MVFCGLVQASDCLGARLSSGRTEATLLPAGSGPAAGHSRSLGRHDYPEPTRPPLSRAAVTSTAGALMLSGSRGERLDGPRPGP